MSHPFFDVPSPCVIGHRGSAGEVPENTLPSFERALAVGAAILESDVHLTRDGVPVLIHDERVERCTNGTGRVADLDLDAVQALDASHGFEAAGNRTNRAIRTFRGTGLPIPTLEEAFRAFPAARFNLELKDEPAEIVERTVEIVVGAGRTDRTLLTAGDDALMARLRAHLEAHQVPVALGASAGEVLGFVRSALDGTAPKAGPMALQVPADFGGRPLVTAEFVAHAHAHGLFVHVWTINHPDEMNRLLDLGVDGLVTDFPDRLAALIEARR